MREESFEAIANELDYLLEAERTALISGDLDRIGRLLHKKETLVERFSSRDTVDKELLASVSGKLKRNQDLLDQALGGIRSVTKRLDALKRVRQSLHTYNSRGEKKSVDLTTRGSVEKRA